MKDLETRLKKLEIGKGFELYIVSICSFCGKEVLGRIDNINNEQCKTHELAPPLKKGDNRIIIEHIKENLL
jgi:hypothetical protein